MSGRAASLWALVPAAAAVLVFSGSLGLGFALDDILLVRDNPSIRELGRLPSLFGEPYRPVPGESYGLYRPVTVASLALNRALAGEGPRGFHAGNLILHAVASALAWFVARRLGVHYGTALAASLLFAVHPLRVEAVANVAGRAELLAAIGVLAAWLAHRRAAEARGSARSAWAVAAAAFWLGAILSKEGAFLAPVVFALDDRLRGRRKGGSAGAPGLAWLAYGAAAVAALALRSRALGGIEGPLSTIYLDNPAAFEGTGPRIATALWVHVRYLALLIWPATLSSDYSYDAIPVVGTWTDPRLWAGVAAAAALAAGYVVARRTRSRTAVVAIACWVLFLLPASNLPFAVGTVMGERLTYLPAFGPFLLAGHALASLATRGGTSRLPRLAPAAAIAIAAALVVACGVRSALRVPAWKDNLTLATTDVLAYPRSAKLRAGAGIFLADQGRYAEAEAHLREAVAIWPDYAQAHYNLSVILLAKGNSAEGLEHLLRAHELAPGNPSPVRLLDRLLANPDLNPEARSEIERRRVRPQTAPAR